MQVIKSQMLRTLQLRRIERLLPDIALTVEIAGIVVESFREKKEPLSNNLFACNMLFSVFSAFAYCILLVS